MGTTIIITIKSLDEIIAYFVGDTGGIIYVSSSALLRTVLAISNVGYPTCLFPNPTRDP